MQNDGQRGGGGGSERDDDEGNSDDSDESFESEDSEDSDDGSDANKNSNAGDDDAPSTMEGWTHGVLTSGCYATTKFQRRLFVCASTMCALQLMFFFYTVWAVLP